MFTRNFKFLSRNSKKSIYNYKLLNLRDNGEQKNVDYSFGNISFFKQRLIYNKLYLT